jgi:hypothetical protein
LFENSGQHFEVGKKGGRLTRLRRKITLLAPSRNRSKVGFYQYFRRRARACVVFGKPGGHWQVPRLASH